MDITTLYRDIGKTFREMGADKIVVVSSKNYSHLPDCNMSMDIVLDGELIRGAAEATAKEKWSFIDMHIQYREDDPSGNLMSEMIADGIWL